MKSRSFIFVPLILVGILVPSYLFLAFHLGDNRFGWVLLFIPFALIGGMPFTWRLRSRTQTRLQIVYSQITYLCMGWLSFAFVCFGLRDLIGIVIKIWLDPMWPTAASFAAVIAGVVWAKLGPQIKKIEIKIENLPLQLKGFKIVQISDLHISSQLKTGYVEKVVRKANSLNADLIALTGDIGDGRAADLTKHILHLRELKSRLGAFFAPGNHEYYSNYPEWQKAFSSIGIIELYNSGQIIESNAQKILIAGIADPAAERFEDFEKPDVKKAALKKDGASLRILMSHRPDFAAEADTNGFQLQLSGHTHGGQFFPWTLVVRAIHKHALGLHKVGQLWLYVSPGTGSWGPFLRLGTTAEITLVELI